MGGRDGLAMDVDMPSFAAENLGGGKWSGICHGAGVRVCQCCILYWLFFLFFFACGGSPAAGIRDLELPPYLTVGISIHI